MTKYTINKAFEKSFPQPIWKIEVDAAQNCIAIEYRDPNTTLPIFSIFDFKGRDILPRYLELEKEWTLEAIQSDFLILKQYGSNTPIKEGIKIIHIPTATVVYTGMEYILQDVYQGIIKATHRSIPSGLDFFIEIATGNIIHAAQHVLSYPCSGVHYPLPYTGAIPSFMQHVSFEDTIWIQTMNDHFIWAYHVTAQNNYDLHLSITSKKEIVDTKIILKNLDKLIPQPYFQVKEYIFFLSNTKQEIVAYFV